MSLDIGYHDRPRAPKLVHVIVALLLALVLWGLAGCAVLGPGTLLEIENQTGALLEASVARCGFTPQPFLWVPAGERRSKSVAPGCYTVEGFTVDWRAAVVRVQVDEGATRRVRFEGENLTGGG